MRSEELDPVGGILAGGRNRRMNGFPKGALRYRGSTFFERVHRAVVRVVDAAFVSIHRGRPAGVPESLCCIRDRYPGVRASMNGLYSLLKTLRRPVLVVPWDMPRVDAVMLKLLLLRWRTHRGSVAAVHLRDGETPVPFPGVYDPGLTASLRSRLEAGEYSVRALLGDCATQVLTRDELKRHPRHAAERLLINVNTPDDLDRLHQET